MSEAGAASPVLASGHAGHGPPIEPVFVPIDPPAPRAFRGVRGDAALCAIEASYAPVTNLHEWLEGICSELDGLGLGSWGSLPVSEGNPILGASMIISAVGLFVKANERATTSRELTRDMHRKACIPERRIVSVQPHWGPLVGSSPWSVLEVESLFGLRLPPATALLCTSADGQEGVVALLDTDRPLPARARHQLEAVAAHVEHAYRLRRKLQSWVAEDAGAVFSPDGKLLHAESDAIPDAGSLTQAVHQSQKARGRLRRLAPEEAIETWKALVEGQWSIAEHVESDGKRLLLAFENAPTSSALKLSPQESRVVSYAALGHQQKYIAYELGLAPSVVSRHLSNALRKLRLKNIPELISVFGPRAQPVKKPHEID